MSGRFAWARWGRCRLTDNCCGTELISESESEMPFRFRRWRHSAFPFLRSSCKTGLYGIVERINSNAWNLAELSESLLSLIYDLNPPTPGAEDPACMIRRRWLFLSCVPLNSRISLRLVSVILIPAPHWHKRSCGHMYVHETLDITIGSKR